MTNVNRDDILKRVQSLFALADNHAATQGEVMAALSQAKKIMARYNLDMMEIDAAKAQSDKSSARWIYEEVEATLPNAKRETHKGYESTLVSAVKVLTGVQAYWTKAPYTDRNKRTQYRVKLVFAGDTVDIHVAKALFEALAATMFQIVYGRYGRTPWTRYHRSFCDGYAHEIWMRANSEQESLSLEEKNCYAIVLANKEDWSRASLYETHADMREGKDHRPLAQHVSAYRGGREAARVQALSVTRALEGN